MILAWAAASIFLAAAGRDLGWRTIDHRLVISLLLLWGGHAALSSWGWQVAFGHLGTAMLALLVSVLLYSLGWMGGGDVKLATAVFLWAGPAHGIGILVLVTLAGGALAVLGLVACLMTRLPLPAWGMRGLGLISTERGVPYGVALAFGGIAAALSVPAGMG
ncbi:MAG: prepilin peptidase [Bacteroidales bacterium]